jgi:filamentous hemagglutinin family protein
MLKSRVYSSVLLVTISLSAALSAQAQIVPASADSTNTLVNQTGNTFFITGGTQTGANLFHSFQQLGLTRGQIAHFLSPPSIQTILGRVVGGEASVIDGLIRVTGSQANLFLMNPAGIVFGQNARLDVPGSFTATTASAIGIGNGWFNAVGSNDYAALVGTPDYFAMTAPQSGAIINMGNLAPGQGQRLTLVGGTVINTGTLSVPGGTVVVATVPGEALVRISQEGSLLSLELPVTSRMAPNPLPFSPQTLPQLLTGHGLGNATGVTVEDGVVSLTGAGIRVENGDVVTKGITAQTASLSSSNNLTLVESQVQTTFDLNLLAANTVWGRDSATGAIALQAGRNLTIQGDQAVDIFALNHPESRLISETTWYCVLPTRFREMLTT